MELARRGQLYRMIGERVRNRREELEMTQSALAELIKVARTSVTNLERGRQQAPVHLLADVAEVLELELRELVPTRAELGTPLRVHVQIDGVERSVTSATKRLIEEILDGDGKETHAKKPDGRARGPATPRSPRRRRRAR